MAKPKNSKLPEEVFVYWEPDGDDGHFLLVQEDLLEAVENAEEGALIGTYHLETTGKYAVNKTVTEL